MTVLTLGETMALFDPIADGAPAIGARYALRVAGAESNFAIALARLGVAVRWISRLGDDAAGELIARTLANEGVEVWARPDERRATTGAFMKIRDGERTGVNYFRRGSAASLLSRDDVADSALDGVRVVHLTGITLALSASAAELVHDVARRACARGIIVTFDANYRASLWPDAAAARDAQRALLPFVDWYFCGAGEGGALWGNAEPSALERTLVAAGARRAVIRVGARGAYADGALVAPRRLVEIRDEIGAGDAFDAGFVFALLAGAPVVACVQAGHLIAAHALGGTGDWETLPRRSDVADELAAIGVGVAPA